MKFKSTKLKYIADIQMGKSPNINEINYKAENRMPFFQTPSDFGDLYPTPKKYCSNPPKVAPPNAILFPLYSTTSNLNITKLQAGIGDSLCSIMPHNSTSAEYIFWCLFYTKYKLKQHFKGSRNKAATLSDIRNMKLPIPSLKIQIEIANFLTKETKHIDKLIKVKEKIIILLDQKEKALIRHAIIKGINSDIKLKDTNIEWIGRIPQHWNIYRSKYILLESNERTNSEQEELLSVSHITGVTSRSEKKVNMFLSKSFVGYKKVNKEDLVINTLWGWMGAMGISPKDGIVSPEYNVYTVSDKMLPAYLNILVKMDLFIEEVNKFSRGIYSSRLRLYPEDLFKINIPVPPINEQTLIVSYLEKKLKDIEELKNITQDSIKLLKEKRLTLIATAITEKIEGII